MLNQSEGKSDGAINQQISILIDFIRFDVH